VGQRTEESGWRRVFDFGKKVVLVTGIDVALTLAVWIVVSLSQGRFGSPAGALLLGALLLFVLAMLPFFFDLGSTLAIPLRVLVQRKGARRLLKDDRPRSETGIVLTFLFFAAGVVVLLLSFLAEWVLRG
jgi:hypothetical protein